MTRFHQADGDVDSATADGLRSPPPSSRLACPIGHQGVYELADRPDVARLTSDPRRVANTHPPGQASTPTATRSSRRVVGLDTELPSTARRLSDGGFGVF